tara:strand:+ start:4860 stop:5075 length:216 start_codon:yes stop_codon:yes gene_type:complete
MTMDYSNIKKWFEDKDESKLKDILFNTDGSYWHNAELLSEELKEFIEYKIDTPSDSWYLFDLHSSNYEETN